MLSTILVLFKHNIEFTIINIAVAMTVLLYLLFNAAEKPKSEYICHHIHLHAFELLMMIKVTKTLSYM